MELLIDGIEYEYRQGEGEPAGINRFGLVDATVALACSQPNVELSVQVKREISKLWDELDRAPYKVMFNSGLTGLRLWHLVQVVRAIDHALDIVKQEVGATRTRNIITHGNRLIAHKMMHGLDVPSAGTSGFQVAFPLDQLKRMVLSTVTNLEAALDREFSDLYIASLFKNLSKCRVLASEVPVPFLSAS